MTATHTASLHRLYTLSKQPWSAHSWCVFAFREHVGKWDWSLGRLQFRQVSTNIRRSSVGAETSACARTRRSADINLPGCNAP